jgi:hypothetical protein
VASLSRVGTSNTTSSKAGMDNVSIQTEAVVLYDEQRPALDHALYNSTKIGELFNSSTSGRELGYDWALIELSEQNIRDTVPVPSKVDGLRDVAFPQRITPTIPKESAVLVLSGFSRVLKGIISSSTLMMRLPHSSTFQEMWTVRLFSPLGKSQGFYVLKKSF